jgi:hypothetical protein
MSNRLDELNVKYEELKVRAVKAENQVKKDLERKLEEAKVKRDAPAKKLIELNAGRVFGLCHSACPNPRPFPRVWRLPARGVNTAPQSEPVIQAACPSAGGAGSCQRVRYSDWLGYGR